MSRRFIATCDCGWSGTYTSHAKAQYALRRHSCQRQIELHQRAQRATARKAAIDRTPKPCQHPVARHQHGTFAAYSHDKCRCHPCVAAAVDYERTRQRRIAYGRWQPYVPAEPARRHVRDLMQAGIGIKRISALTGVPHGAISGLIYGKRRDDGTHRPPAARIRRATADALLALQPDLDALSGRAHVDGTGTRRRLRALVAIGWSQTSLAARLGMEVSNLGRIIDTGRPVRAATARAVRDLYRDLSDRQPPQETRHQMQAAARARNMARARGWLVPAWWDDDTIDDPAVDPRHVQLADDAPPLVDAAAVERAINGERLNLSAAERAEAVRRLCGCGLSDTDVAARLHISTRTVVRIRGRLGIPASVDAGRNPIPRRPSTSERAA